MLFLAKTSQMKDSIFAMKNFLLVIKKVELDKQMSLVNNRFIK